MNRLLNLIEFRFTSLDICEIHYLVNFCATYMLFLWKFQAIVMSSNWSMYWILYGFFIWFQFSGQEKENFQEYACLFNYFSGMQMSVSIYVYVYLHIKYLLGFCQGQIYICEYSCFLLCCEEFFHFPISKNSWLFTNIAAHLSHFSCIDLWAHLLTFDCKVSVIIVSLLAC